MRRTKSYLFVSQLDTPVLELMRSQRFQDFSLFQRSVDNNRLQLEIHLCKKENFELAHEYLSYFSHIP